jgi:hypothetical protein
MNSVKSGAKKCFRTILNLTLVIIYNYIQICHNNFFLLFTSDNASSIIFAPPSINYNM